MLEFHSFRLWWLQQVWSQIISIRRKLQFYFSYYLHEYWYSFFFSLPKFLYQEMVRNYIFLVIKIMPTASENWSRTHQKMHLSKGGSLIGCLRHLFLCLKCNKGHMLHLLNLIKKLLQLNRQQKLFNKCLPFFCRNANHFRSTSSKNGKFP